MLRSGFRTDTVLSSNDKLTVQGDIYQAREGVPTINFPSVTAYTPLNIEQIGNLSGGFIQGVWGRQWSPHSDTKVEVSYDEFVREDILREERGTLHADFQHHFSGWARQDIVWGLNYQFSAANSTGNLTAAFVPADLNTQVSGAFGQDEIAIIPERLFLTLGTKLEHDYYTGFHLMPSARVAWAFGLAVSCRRRACWRRVRFGRRCRLGAASRRRAGPRP